MKMKVLPFAVALALALPAAAQATGTLRVWDSMTTQQGSNSTPSDQFFVGGTDTYKTSTLGLSVHSLSPASGLVWGAKIERTNGRDTSQVMDSFFGGLGSISAGAPDSRGIFASASLGLASYPQIPIPYLGPIAVINPTISVGYSHASENSSDFGPAATGAGAAAGGGVGLSFSRLPRAEIFFHKQPLALASGPAAIASPWVVGARYHLGRFLLLSGGVAIPQLTFPFPAQVSDMPWVSAKWTAGRVSLAATFVAGGTVCAPESASLTGSPVRVGIRDLAPEWPIDPSHPLASYARGLSLNVGYGLTSSVNVGFSASYSPEISSTSPQILWTAGTAGTAPYPKSVPVTHRQAAMSLGARVQVRF